MTRPRWNRGGTLIEVLVGSVIGAVLVGGLMASYVTALRISQTGAGGTEAAGFAQATLERQRNKIACDDPWFPVAPCGFGGAIVGAPDGLPPGALYGTGTRTYDVTPDDCDGVGGVGDCFKVAVKVSWTPPS